VCKDNGWAITTRSEGVTGGDLVGRAAAFGLPTADVDGADVAQVEKAASAAVARARHGRGPSFLRARVPRLDGHFLGDAPVRAAASPAGDGRETLASVAAAAVSRGGAGLAARAGGVLQLLDLLRRARRRDRDTRRDPLERARRALREDEADRIEADAAAEIARAIAAALEGER
jgi:TPP-dependent pyruvate/acetoin dehydrogenase alpha subunit